MEEPKEPFWDPDEPGIFDDPAAIERADARAMPISRRGVENEVVVTWLQEIAAGRRPPVPQSAR